MPLGTSCKGCVWSQWEQSNRHQQNCSLNRLDILSNITVWDGDGTHRVLTDNICAARRSLLWLKRNCEEDPKDVLAKELFPRVQLLLLVDNLNDWEILKDPQLEKFYSIDILSNSSAVVRNYKSLLVNKNYNLHYCYNKLESHINEFVLNDCQYYMIVTKNDWRLPENFLDTLNKYINKDLKNIFSIYPQTSHVMDEFVFDGDLNGFFVSCTLHKELDGFGSQSMVEKVEIDSYNRNYFEKVFWDMEDFMKEAQRDK